MEAKSTLAAPRSIFAPVVSMVPRKVTNDGVEAVMPPVNLLLPSVAPIVKVPALLKVVFPPILLAAPKIEILYAPPKAETVRASVRVRLSLNKVWPGAVKFNVPAENFPFTVVVIAERISTMPKRVVVPTS